MKALRSPPPEFRRKKAKILDQLSVPDTEYADASPKGSVDAGIRHLIDEINRRDGLVTTSSCAGRVSVYLDGGGGGGDRKAELASASTAGTTIPAEQGEGFAPANGQSHDIERDVAAGTMGTTTPGRAGPGGKGGGSWLFVSHDPVDVGADDDERDWPSYLGLATVPEGNGGEIFDWTAPRLIHFKFEPMILHILTASHEHAQLVVQAGLEAGFRESGAINIARTPGPQDATPMVAIRSMGLSFESLVGVESQGVKRCLVTTAYFRTLVRVANERFVENSRRITRFQEALRTAFGENKSTTVWEDAEVRRNRKREEGMRRRERLRKENDPKVDPPGGDSEDQIPIDELF